MIGVLILLWLATIVAVLVGLALARRHFASLPPDDDDWSRRP